MNMFSGMTGERHRGMQVEPSCDWCHGSGEGRAMEGRGPDTYEITIQCETCGGSGAAPAQEQAEPLLPEPDEHACVGGVSQPIYTADTVRAALRRAAPAQEPQPPDPCPQCRPGVVCRTPRCGRLRAKAAASLVQLEVTQVGSISKAHLKAQPGPWCKEILLYSPDNQGDYPEDRVMLFALATHGQPKGGSDASS